METTFVIYALLLTISAVYFYKMWRNAERRCKYYMDDSDKNFKDFIAVARENLNLEKNNTKSETKVLPLCVVTRFNLEKGKRVTDYEGNRGFISKCEDLHNVVIEYDKGGMALVCYKPDCSDNEEKEAIHFYYCG